MPNHSDLRSELSDGSMEEGIRLKMTFKVYKILDSYEEGKGTCVPFNGAIVDLWEANYKGRYSGVRVDGTKGLVYLCGYCLFDSKERSLDKNSAKGLSSSLIIISAIGA